MERPDLDTLACVNAECPLHRKTHQGNLGVRKVYGRDAIRLLRCRTCGEEFSERRGTALVNTKVSETKAVPRRSENSSPQVRQRSKRMASRP